MKKYSKICPKCFNEQYYSSEDSLNFAIRKNSLCKRCSTLSYAKRKGDASFLLNDTLESYYWLGFILADGHISNNRLTIALTIKDKNHLQKLASKLGIKCNDYTVSTNFKNNITYSKISLMDTQVFSKLVKLYDIRNNKTINPPNINNISGDKLIALKIGFIDGDGTIKNLHNRPDFHIIIKCHKNWINNLKYMFGESYLNPKGYAISHISNTIDSKKLKRFALLNNLPILNRKWDIINLKFTSRRELCLARLKVVKMMLENKRSISYIAEKLKISHSGVYLLIKRNNL